MTGIGVAIPSSLGVSLKGGSEGGSGSLSPDALGANWSTEDGGNWQTEDGGLWLLEA